MTGGPKPPTPPIGDTAMAAWCRNLLIYLKSLEVKSFVGGNVSRGPGGTLLDAGTSFAVGGAGASVGRGYFLTPYGNYNILSQTATGTGTLYRVAKPPDMRNNYTVVYIEGQRFDITYPLNPANWDTALTYTPPLDPLRFQYRKLTANGGVNNGLFEFQGINPPYLSRVGVVPEQPDQPREIYFIDADTGITTVPADTGATAGTAVTLLEVSSRTWYRRLVQT